MNRLDKTKIWLKAKWTKLKAWVLALLVALGLVAAPLLYAEVVTFTYARATQYDNGVLMPLDEIQFTRLYCDGSMVAEEPGADLDIEGNLGIGTHDCYGTHVDIYDRESVPSNTVQRIVSPPGTGPGAPVLDP